MGEELTRSLTMLAERGVPRGAAEVLDGARRIAGRGSVSGRPGWRRGMAVAFGAAAVVLLLVGAVILFVRPFSAEEPAPIVTEPPAVTTTVSPGTESAGLFNDVRDLAFAPDGQLWAVTSAGLVRWDIATSTPVTFGEQDGVPSSNVTALDIAPDGTVWIAGNDWIGRYDGSWQVFSPANVPELDSQLGFDLVVDRNGVVWVIEGSEYLLRFDGSWTAVAPSAGERIDPLTGGEDLATAPDGTLWVSTTNKGVVAFDGTTWQRYTEDDGAPQGPSNVAVAPDGSIWFGSGRSDTPGRGIARFDGSTWTVFTVDDGLLSNGGSVVAAPDGTVWVVHHEIGPKGLSRFDGSTWATYPDLDENLDEGVRGAAAGDGSLWLSGASGIVGFDGTDTTLLVVPPELAPQRLPAITLTPAADQVPVRVSTIIGALEFTTMQFPVGHGLGQLAGTRHGPVAIDSFTTLRWSTDGVTWGAILPTVDPWRITTANEGFIVHGEELARYAWDGSRWTGVSIVDLPGAVRYIALGPRGTVAVSETGISFSTEPTVYYSTNGVSFAPAEAGPNRELLTTDKASCVQSGSSSYSEPPQFHIGPVMASEAGFVVLTPAHPDNWSRTPICEPLLWFSEDGNRWELLSSQSPFGEGAIVHNIAEHAGRFVAIGATRDPEGDPEGAVWFSDDGVYWQRADVELESAEGIAGGDLGWILTGNSQFSASEDGAPVGMWFSADGATWDGPYEAPPTFASVYFLPELAVGTDAIYGVGGTHDTLVIGRLQE
ncbi:MAG: hypothetical protein OEM84_07390 [Acidimicrobiia bacterium]|nr:hypothetical protein [Acidimicrobiia bacterium]